MDPPRPAMVSAAGRSLKSTFSKTLLIEASDRRGWPPPERDHGGQCTDNDQDYAANDEEHGASR